MKIRQPFTPYDFACAHCGKVVHINRSIYPPRRFCSIRCARHAQTGPTHIAVPKIKLTCQYAPCGQDFFVKRNRIATAKYCSRKCAGAGWRADTFARFMARVRKTSTCWLWTGAADGLGYGFVGVNRKNKLAHRYSYEMHRGAIPTGLVLDHLCRNPACVNPDHLEPVTIAENVRRSPLIRRTHCPKGHLLSEDNLCPERLRRGLRLCRICRRAQVKRTKAKQIAKRQAALAKQCLEAETNTKLSA